LGLRRLLGSKKQWYCIGDSGSRSPDGEGREKFDAAFAKLLRPRVNVKADVRDRLTAISLVTLSCSRNCFLLSESAPSSAQRRLSCSGFSSSDSRRSMPFSLLSSTDTSCITDKRQRRITTTAVLSPSGFRALKWTHSVSWPDVVEDSSTSVNGLI